MSAYSVRREWSLHEGRTKFYQTFVLSRDGGPAVAVHHYGKASRGADVDPAEFGIVKMQEFRSDSRARMDTDRKRLDKEKRGYKSWQRSNHPFADDSAFYKYLLATFKPADADKIWEMMGASSTVPLSGEPAPRKKEAPEMKPAAKPEASKTSSDWGTW